MIEVRDATVALAPDRAPVLQGVNLTVAPGQLVAVIGENGSGKTTLARLLCAVHAPDEGCVVVDGHGTAGAAAELDAVRRLVGCVRQDPADQIVMARVYDEVAFGPRNLGLDEDEVTARVEGALACCGLCGLEQRPTSELSGGEEQRLAIAGVLAMRPRYVVLDEPFAHVDAAQRPRLRALVQELAHGHGAGVVLVTHDEEEALDADAVLVLEQGRALYLGAPEDLRGREPALWNRLLGACPAPPVAGPAGGGAPEGADGALRPAKPGATRPTASTLRCEGLSYSYGGHRVLDGLDLEARPGRVLLLAGPSGCGKSTFAALAAGLYQPDAGRVTLGGAGVAPGRVGLALQDPERQFFLDTVFDEVAFGPRNLGLSETEVEARVAAAVRAVGLDEGLLGRDPFTLSGGEARLAAIASVFSLDAEACIFDEPTAGLDGRGRAAVHAMARAQAQAGRVVIVISHDLAEWRRTADDVVTLAPAAPTTPAAPDTVASHDARRARRATGMARASGPQRAPVDARVKLALLFEATACLFACGSLHAMALWTAALAACLVGAGVRPRRLAGALRPAALALALVLCANAVRCDGTADIALAGPLGLSASGAAAGAMAVWRIALLVGFVLAFAATTEAAELVDAVVRVMRPLGRWGLPVDSLGSALSLAVRFVPLAGQEFERIQLAQRARGVDFDAGPLIGRARRWVAVFAPLIIGLFRRADALADSMTARCYAGRAQVPPKSLRWQDRALLCAGTAAALAVLVLAGR